MSQRVIPVFGGLESVGSRQKTGISFRRAGLEIIISFLNPFPSHISYNTKANQTHFMLRTPIGRFRITAFLEGISFILILAVSMPLKYYYDMPEPNQVIGMAHGLLFVLYCFQALALTIQNSWPFKALFILFVASILPFGTFYFVPKVLRERGDLTS